MFVHRCIRSLHVRRQSSNFRLGYVALFKDCFLSLVNLIYSPRVQFDEINSWSAQEKLPLLGGITNHTHTQATQYIDAVNHCYTISSTIYAIFASRFNRILVSIGSGPKKKTGRSSAGRLHQLHQLLSSSPSASSPSTPSFISECELILLRPTVS